MTSFAAALRDYQEGTCSKAELEQLIDRDISLGTAAGELFDLLQNHHNSTPLQPDDFAIIRDWISRAETRQRTQINPQPASAQDPTETVTVTVSQTEITIGSVINDRFVLESSIGSGGMSQVFKAADKRKLEARSRDPYLAVKVMDVRGIEAEQAFVAMQREVQKSLALTHQNIVRVYDFDRDGDIVYTTMELLEGESLQQKIARSGPNEMPVDEAIRLVHEMGAALECAHENNIVHADFKPSNVFVTVKNRVKVIDFGIARAIRSGDQTGGDQTVFDARELGAMTPAYASPEMIEDLEPHPRDDIYALGCVTYELITGVHPYSRLMATQARDRNHPLSKPENLNKAQWTALEKTLKFDPNERTSSVKEFLDGFKPAATKKGNGILIGAAALAAVAIAAGINYLLPLFESDTPPIAGPDPRASPSQLLLSDCPTCPTMRVVRAGISSIGQPKSDLPGMFEYPEHKVAFASDFAISTTEVTVAQFREYADARGGTNWQGCRSAENESANSAALSWRTPGFTQSGDQPVTCVSWQDAQNYAVWLSGQTGQSYRLPSEAEWEYTARTFTEQPLLVAEDSAICEQANVADATAAAIFGDMAAVGCSDGVAYTARVTRFGESEVPTDLRGNVFEWTQDCWNPSYEGAPRDGAAWQSGDCTSRVLRGGSWFSSPDALRLTYRNHFPTNYRSNTFGFRIVRAL